MKPLNFEEMRQEALLHAARGEVILVVSPTGAMATRVLRQVADTLPNGFVRQSSATRLTFEQGSLVFRSALEGEGHLRGYRIRYLPVRLDSLQDAWEVENYFSILDRFQREDPV